MNETTMNFAAKTQFVNALLACPTIQDRQTRDAIVNSLENVQGISRSDIDRTDVANIVDRVLDFQNGLAQLCEVLRFYEGDSMHMQQVEALYAQHGGMDTAMLGIDGVLKASSKSRYVSHDCQRYRLVFE